MKRPLLLLCLLVMMPLLSAKAAYADLIFSYNDVETQWSYSGTYMFTVEGNDSQILRNNGTSPEALQLIQHINNWFSDNTALGGSYLESLVEYAKYEDGVPNDKLAVQYGASHQFGLWTCDAAIEFYVVKAGNSFALYWLGEGGAAFGTWTAEHVNLVGKGNIPELSHFTGYNKTDIGAPEPVPEPASVLLLGMGALGLVAVYRKRMRA